MYEKKMKFVFFLCFVVIFRYILQPHRNFLSSVPSSHKKTNARIKTDAGFDIPIYWINLKSASKRRRAMEKMLHNYSHFRIDATSGLDAASAKVLHIPNLNFYHEKKDDIIWKKHWSGNYTFKELATCMSHLKAIREAYERGDNMALIY